MAAYSRRDVAGRIREILARGEGEDWGAVAERLGVGELALRMSVDELAPHPTIEVLGALVEKYGVDPSWLLTGECDPDIHREVLDGATHSGIHRALMKLTPEGMAAIPESSPTDF